MRDWTARMHMVLLQKNKPQTPKTTEKKNPKPWLPCKDDPERYHTQPWQAARCSILLWPFSMCAKLELYSAACLALINASISCVSRGGHASQKGQAAGEAGRAACLHGWSFLGPARENKAAGEEEGASLSLEGAVTSPNLLP